jgi:hypothetical protein
MTTTAATYGPAPAPGVRARAHLMLFLSVLASHLSSHLVAARLGPFARGGWYWSVWVDSVRMNVCASLREALEDVCTTHERPMISFAQLICFQ